MSTDQITLSLTERDTLGKGVKSLRRDGFVPAVIHDHGKPSIHVQAVYQDILKAFQKAGKHHPIEVTAGSKKYTTIIKTVTFDPHYNSLSHVVFGAIKANEKVEAEIPVHPRYAEDNDASPAERSGLIVLAQLTTVMVKALPKDLPDALTYDAEKLVEVGDHITVADLTIPGGVELEVDLEHTIATVFEPSALAAANDEAGGDAEVGDEQAVDSDVTPENVDESAGGEDEISPGGKEQKESHDQGVNPERQ